MATRDERFRQAAWAYGAYGVVYWLGGLTLAAAGHGPRGMERRGVAWFVVGALLIVIVPWLLVRDRAWFDRWMLTRRDFARLVALAVGLRAIEVARLARVPRSPEASVVSVLGAGVPLAAGAWAFCVVTLVTAAMLVRAGWGRPA